MEERKGIVYNSQITNFTYSSKEERDYFEKKYMADQLKKQSKLQEEYNELLKKQIESSENQQREMESKQRAIENYEIEKSWNEYKEDLKHEAFDKLTVEQLKSTINRKKKKLQELKEQNLGDPLCKSIEKTTIESTLQPSVILIFEPEARLPPPMPAPCIPPLADIVPPDITIFEPSPRRSPPMPAPSSPPVALRDPVPLIVRVPVLSF